MARKGIREHWLGGRTFTDPETGRKSWVIERCRGGRRRAVRLDVDSERGALAELALFERDPDGYRTGTQRRRDDRDKAKLAVLTLTDQLINDFCDDLLERGRTPFYVEHTCRHYLEEWQGALGDKNIKAVSLQELQGHLKGKKARRHRMVAVKSFFSYLRRSGLVLPSEDVTRSLQLPPIRPERAIRSKGYSVEHVEKIYRAIGSQPVRDVIVLRALCGMHFSEIDRLSRGEGKIRLLDGDGPIAAVISYPHKRGSPHSVSVDAQTLAAAQRLQKLGRAPVDTWVRRALDRAAKKAEVATICPGQLRHSFCAWAYSAGKEVRPDNGGLPLASVAAVLGHTSWSTTAKFYHVAPIPALVQVPVHLVHPDDPALPSRLNKSGAAVKASVKADEHVAPPNGVPPAAEPTQPVLH